MSEQKSLENTIQESCPYDGVRCQYYFKSKYDLAQAIQEAGYLHESDIEICIHADGKMGHYDYDNCPNCHGKGWVRKDDKV